VEFIRIFTDVNTCSQKQNKTNPNGGPKIPKPGQKWLTVASQDSKIAKGAARL